VMTVLRSKIISLSFLSPEIISLNMWSLSFVDPEKLIYTKLGHVLRNCVIPVSLSSL